MPGLKSKPPLIPYLLLKLFLPKSDSEYLLGDYNDIYESIYHNKGRLSSDLWYWKHSFLAVPGFLLNSFYWGITMFKNYLVIAFRYLLKEKGYTFFNIAGLSIAITCSLILFLWVQNEFSYDSSIKDSDNIYRIVQKLEHAGSKNKIARSQIPLIPAIKSDFPEVIGACRFFQFNQKFEINKNKVNAAGGFIDPDFLDMFSVEFLSGDKNNCLNNPHDILITETLARKLFRNETALGKVIELDRENHFTITGVLKDYPINSHISFDYLMPFEILFVWGVPKDAWKSVNNPIYSYIKTDKPIEAASFNLKIENIVNEKTDRQNTKLFIQPLNDIYLHSDFRGDYAGLGNIEYVYISMIMGIFILGIACFNFLNLSSSKIIGRTKEIGVRKVIGALRRNLIIQYLTETYIIVFISFIISLGLIIFYLPEFNSLIGKSLYIDLKNNLLLLLVLIFFPILLGLLAGFYPSFILSSFNPSSILSGTSKTKISGSPMKKVIVITQFTLAISICIGMIVMYQQFDYIQNKWLGFNKEALMWFEVSQEMKSNFDVFKNEVTKDPSIENASLSSHLLTDVTHIMGQIDWEGKEEDSEFEINCLLVDENFIPTLDMKLKDGRNFSKEHTSDLENSVILNETALKLMNLSDPLNKKIGYHSNDLNIVGIVEDFHFKPLQSAIEPMVLVYSEEEELYMYVRINPNNILSSVEKIEEIWAKVFPNTIYDPQFLDSEISAMYSNEEKMKNIFQAFTLISILISCFGLFGLASFMAEKKTKEIGIRKAVGASTLEIVYMLTKQFALWVITANLIAIPVSYYVMSEWLNSFEYRIDISITIFILTGISTLLIALGTVAYQTIKAARVNPIESLKYE